jgi:protein MpaA
MGKAVAAIVVAALVSVALVRAGDSRELRPVGSPRHAQAGPDLTSSQRPHPNRPPLGKVRGIRSEPIRLGNSALGRPISVTAFGDSGSRRRVLVVGCIHGTECAGIDVLRRLGGCPPANVDVWLLDNLNPDGLAESTRLNGRGVDLNRNFDSGWTAIGRRWDLQYSGPRPWSEPETRIARRLILRIRPEVTIWFHQQAQPLVRAWGASFPAARRYARVAGLRPRRMPWMAGTAPNWQNHRFPGSSSFVVELAPGPLSLDASVRHAAAIEQLAGYRGENRYALERAHRR